MTNFPTTLEMATSKPWYIKPFSPLKTRHGIAEKIQDVDEELAQLMGKYVKIAKKTHLEDRAIQHIDWARRALAR